MKYLLEARYDMRLSFYGKAKVEVQGDTKTLYSYDTKILTINAEGVDGAFNVELWSRTTTRHLKEFLMQELSMTESEIKEWIKNAKKLQWEGN